MAVVVNAVLITFIAISFSGHFCIGAIMSRFGRRGSAQWLTASE